MLSKKILSQINSPFIVKLYYSFQDKENLYFILEFVKEEIYFFYWKKKKIIRKYDKILFSPNCFSNRLFTF